MNDDYIARKERWARKLAGQKKPSVRSADRLPPGQHQVRNFPVLDLGLRPEVPLDQWTLKLHGLVENPVTLSWEQFRALPQFKDVSDFHCVTTWSQFDMAWEGVAFFTLAELVKPRPEARHVFFKSYDGYSTNNPIEVCLDDDVLIAHSWNGHLDSIMGPEAGLDPGKPRAVSFAARGLQAASTSVCETGLKRAEAGAPSPNSSTPGTKQRPRTSAP